VTEIVIRAVIAAGVGYLVTEILKAQGVPDWFAKLAGGAVGAAVARIATSG
jgi:uncharacterized membrane protein YjjP (DUF1212 family)